MKVYCLHSCFLHLSGPTTHSNTICWVCIVTTARIALAYWTTFLTLLYPIFHANEYSCPPLYCSKFSFLFFLKMHSLRQKINTLTVFSEAFLNADLLLLLVMTQLSACTGIPIQHNWRLNKNKICLIKCRCKINCSKPSFVFLKHSTKTYWHLFILFLLDLYFNFTTSILIKRLHKK